MNRLVEPQPFWRGHLREILGIALLALAIHDVFGAHGFLAMRRAQHKIHAVQGNLTRLTRENNQLSEQIKSLKSDPNTIERIAREQMGLARPGEIIFKLPPADKSAAPTNPATDAGSH